MSAEYFGIKVVPRFFALFYGEGPFYFILIGGSFMGGIDLLSLLLIVVGAIIVYGSKYILKLLKINPDEMKQLVLKVIGFIIACIGFFRVFDII